MKNKGLAFLFCVGVLLASCAKKDTDGSDLLLVCIEPQRYILEQLADSSMVVKTLLKNGSNPETFDPSSAERVAVDKADIFFATGVLPFENTLKLSATDTKFVDTSKGVDFIYGTHSHTHSHDGHHHGDADPHYWGSIAGAKTIATNMAAALIEQYPEKNNFISGRLVKYTAHLDSLQEIISSKLDSSKGSTFIVWHPSLSYFARDYGLHQLSVGLEGKELSSKGLKDAIDIAKQNNAKVFFFQQEYDSRQARTINDGIGSRLVIINPLEYDWETQLIRIADEIAK